MPPSGLRPLQLVSQASSTPSDGSAAGDPDESAVVVAARDGNLWAQGRLFKSHAPRLLPMLTRLLSSSSDAEDALQDAFIEAFRDLKQLQELQGFGGWLRRIAVHQAHRRFRRRKMLSLLGLDRTNMDAALEQLADSSISAEARAELGRLDVVLQRVPVDERTAWFLRCVEGYELTEVASACDCSLATAKRRIAAAQKRIAKHVCIAEPEPNEEERRDG